jgi:hypothetical protein
MTDRETLKALPPDEAMQAWIGRVWHIWRSDAGSGAHYATRRGNLTNEQMLEGYERTLPADTPEELRRLLLSQPDAPQVEE